MNPADPFDQVSLRPVSSDAVEEGFQRVMDELEILTSVLADVADEDVADRLTMWIDYMIYRVLYDSGQEPDFAPEARECRKLIMAHLDEMAWSAGAEAETIAAPSR